MAGGGEEWGLLATLQGARRTRIHTCLRGGADRAAVLERALRVQGGLDGGDYGALLGALDCSDDRVAHKTDLVEMSLLAMLYDIKLHSRRKGDFRAAMEPHEEKFLEVAGALARARSLDVSINTRSLPSRHGQLVDYVSRIHLSRSAETDNPQFWRWLEGGYPHICRVLRAYEEGRMNKANTFVHMLSVQFKHRETSGGHMAYVDSVCRRAAELCRPRALREYARKICDSYGSAITEMRMLAILDREFGGAEVEPALPRSKNADLGIEFGGERYYVEVYTATTFTFAGSLSKFRVDPRDEWKYLLGKKQVKELKGAGGRTVLVLNVGRECLDEIETRTPGFRELVCEMMPPHSELVIVRGNDDAEVISVRDGQIAGATDLGRALGSALERGWGEAARAGYEARACERASR